MDMKRYIMYLRSLNSESSMAGTMLRLNYSFPANCASYAYFLSVSRARFGAKTDKEFIGRNMF